MADFLMPSLGADMETGTLVQWRVKPGDRVRPGDVVAVVETHKGAIDVEIFLDGIIDDLVPTGTVLPVGGVLAHVRHAGEVAPSPVLAPAPAPPAPPAPAATAARTAAPPVPSAAPQHAKASPAARRLAQELGVDPQSLRGTGVDGSVTLADVERASHAAPQAVHPPGPAAPRAGFDPAQMRVAIAHAMSRSKREIPHYYLASTVDFGAASAWLSSYNSDRPPAQRLLPAALLIKAAALALLEVPQLNGFYENGAARPGAGIHIGWAISLRGGGLVAPALHDADRKPLPELMAALRDLVQRARTGGLRSSELTDPTITVTSLGERGADSVLGVIYPPQLAIVGFGRIVERPCVVGGRIEARPMVNVSLAADHRATDGHIGGQLLAAIEQALQRPEAL
jgi:pyruvate dehydrogenase E2 component (dihydrolipoamide acetyltransferase)